MAENADVIYTIRADSSHLETDLNQAENLVRQSAERTEQALDGVAESAENSGERAAEAVENVAQSAHSKETDLADVINAITRLQRKVEKFEDAFGDMTIELTAGDLTIGRACVRDCNIMAKRSGKSPFNF